MPSASGLAAAIAVAGMTASLGSLSERAQNPQPAQVCGRVVKVTCDSRTRVTRLEFKPKSKKVIVAVRSSDRAAFRPSVEEFLRDAQVCAAGTTGSSKGKPTMWLSSPAEITVTGRTRMPSSWADGAWRECDDGLEMPKLVHEVEPRYTRDAMSARLQGVVALEAIVMDDGLVGPMRVTRSLDRKLGLDDEAVTALRQWQFAPGTRNGTPVPVVVEVEMSFTLK